MNIDLNFDAMTEEQKRVNYFDLVARLENLTNDADGNLVKLMQLFLHSQNRTQCAKFVLLLMNGRCATYDAITALISIKDLDELELTTSGFPKIAQVIACKARKHLKKYEIEILNLRGQGYIMRPADIKKLRDLMGGVNEAT